jgi:hypothetical protein
MTIATRQRLRNTAIIAGAINLCFFTLAVLTMSNWLINAWFWSYPFVAIGLWWAVPHNGGIPR